MLHRVDFAQSKGISGATKQYERFRDTIFLNYWAIVFVQDVEVVFLISFDFYFHVFFVISFLFFFLVCSKMVCLSFCFVFHCRIFLAFLIY